MICNSGAFAQRATADGHGKGIPPAMTDKLRKLLFALETAEKPEQLGRFPGLEAASGSRKSQRILEPDGNWRLIFRYADQTDNGNRRRLIWLRRSLEPS